MKPEDLKKRTKQFALRVLKLVAALPKNLAGKTIGGQLVRSAFWMELIIESELLKLQLVPPLLDEANELAKIMASSRKSASESLKTKFNGKLAIGNRNSAMTYG
jgi:hypothetical protein